MERKQEPEWNREDVLRAEHLSVSFDTPRGEIEAVRDVSFSLKRGEVLAIVGESGCGKSVLCKAIMKLLPDIARIKAGSIFINGTDITGYRERDMRRLRGRLFSMVFQDPLTALNPTLTVGRQIGEAVLAHHRGMPAAEVRQRVLELMRLVEIDRPEERYGMYPYHFSGGMRQRVVMAIALAAEPQILFADEPTTSLDVTIQGQILDLLRGIQKKLSMATVLVSHDLGVVARAADRVAVMYAGRIVEIGTVEEIFYDPRHPYTWGLMQSLPAFSKGRERLSAIPGLPPVLINPPKGDAFACRNPYALAIDYEEQPPMFSVTETHAAATWLLDARAPEVRCPVERCPDVRCPEANRLVVNCPMESGSAAMGAAERHLVREKVVLNEALHSDSPGGKSEIFVEVRHVSHRYKAAGRASVRALQDVSFSLYRGEIFGLVGESGSGKSTMARCLMNLCRPSEGAIFYDGIDTCDPVQFRRNRRRLQARRQLVFQDSASSLNQRMKVADLVTEAMRIQRRRPERGSMRAEAEFWLRRVGLDDSFLDRYPPELSGGQRQRVAIARALSMEPEFLVADEPVASLDVSIQAQIVNLFLDLQRETKFTLLFIAHDLSMVEFLCDRVGVLCRGRLVEVAPTKELFAHPLHGYTKSLLSAIPVPDPRQERERVWTAYDWREDAGGALREVSPGHFVCLPEDERHG